jgi:Mannosyl-glycoprotein endo-beta-N-acetylglucosaminidase
MLRLIFQFKKGVVIMTAIMGQSVVAPEKMVAFVREVNPDAQDIEEIAKCFIEVGNKYGVRGDMAFCQSIKETGWFTFEGSAVTPDQHNYCGMGVLSKGMKGNSFTTVRNGVTAQIQHLFAYASKLPLPDDDNLLDPRFKYVTRGIAPAWEDLSMLWAMNEIYGQQIVEKYNELLEFEYHQEEVEPPLMGEPQSGSNIDKDLPPEDEEESLFELFKRFWNKLLETIKIKE